jgi:transcriptional regulator with XRE-family HTH domain
VDQQALAGLAGISQPYLSMIERGERAVTKRATVEALARALQVSPTELTGQPYQPSDPLSSEAHSGIAAVEIALDRYELGVDPDVASRPWPEVLAAINELNGVLRAEADYIAQSRVVPGLLADLHATYARDPRHRRDALVGLMYAYRSAASICKNLGIRGLPLLAARLARICAEELDSPEWVGYAVYLRGIMSGPYGRPHQHTMSVRAIDQLAGHMERPSVVQVAGTLHLNAALASAVQGDTARVNDHLNEAANLAAKLPERRENFAGLYFGLTNVAFWRVSLATELGEGAKVAELTRGVRLDEIPVASWQATFYADLGRALASESSTRDEGIRAMVKAESLAPQLVRNNVFVREAVADLLRRARRDAGGRELRGLAWRMGVAPTG